MDITYHPAVGAPVPVKAIFSDPFMPVDGDQPSGVEAIAPSVFLKLEDLPIHPDFDEPTLTINGLSYKVIGRVPAGLGAIVLRLRQLP